MAKINKKNLNKAVTKKHKNKNVNVTKECVVKLLKMSQKEIQMYTRSDFVVTKNFYIKIKDDTLEFNGKKIIGTDKVFNIKLNRQFELVLDANSGKNPFTFFR